MEEARKVIVILAVSSGGGRMLQVWFNKSCSIRVLYRFTVIALLGAAVLSGCSQDHNNSEDRIVVVSMVQLIAAPEKYEGAKVSVIGFYRSVGLEDSAIYLMGEDARVRNVMSSIFITGYTDGHFISSHAFERRLNNYVSVVGRFRSGPAGHMGLWPGEIVVDHLSSFDSVNGKWMPEMPVVQKAK